MENPAPNFQQNVHSDKIKEGLFTAGLQNNAFNTVVLDGDKKSTHAVISSLLHRNALKILQMIMATVLCPPHKY